MADKRKIEHAHNIVKLGAQINDLEELQSKERAALWRLMKAGEKFETPRCKVTAFNQTKAQFDMGKLSKVLTPAEWDLFCPRSPDTESLKQRIKTDPKRAAALRKCGTFKTEKRVLVTPAK